jgi:hypothetical protein
LALQAIKDLERRQRASHSASDPIGESADDFSYAADLGTIGGGTR